MQIQGILFDLDNTLTHREHSIDAYSLYLAEQFFPCYTRSDLKLIGEIIRSIDQGGYPDIISMTHPSIGDSVAFALLKQLDWKNPPSMQQLTEFWFQQFGLAAVAMDHAEAVLHKLKAMGYKLAVVSNGAHATRLKIIEGLGFSHYFDLIMSSEAAGVSKPNAQIFHTTCAQLKLKPEQVLYIGDHPINDFLGATQAGLRALLLQGFHAEDVAEGYRIAKLTEIFDYL
ncbi:putative hydrolase of the HAD superfamily [Acinetobacter calcoaceticus]|uniref:Putative hydrolase of the HAD superfamily n=1 Tax=Acinetobacter calcoaceticus TaxID=471 RepID=A0A4R1XSY3_ACICA|nr:putative hydrolase of the HAD superfamily [Acinetobacter calcoaceticus]